MAKLSFMDVRIGDTLRAEAGFTCLAEGQEVVVQGSWEGVWVECSEGEHFLRHNTDAHMDLIGFTMSVENPNLKAEGQVARDFWSHRRPLANKPK